MCGIAGYQLSPKQHFAHREYIVLGRPFHYHSGFERVVEKRQLLHCVLKSLPIVIITGIVQ